MSQAVIESTGVYDEVSQIPELISPIPEQKGISLYGIKVVDTSNGTPSYIVTVPAQLFLSVVTVDRQLQREPKPGRIKELKEIFLSGQFQNTIPLSAKMPISQVNESPLDKDGRLVSLEIKSPIHLADGSHRYSAFKELWTAYDIKDYSKLDQEQMDFFGQLLRSMEFVLAIFTSEKIGQSFMADAQKQLLTINSVAPMSKGLIANFGHPDLVRLLQKHKIYSIVKNPTGEAIKGAKAILDYSILQKAQDLIGAIGVKSKKLLSKAEISSLLELGISVYENLEPVKTVIDLVDEYNSALLSQEKQSLKEIDASIVDLKQKTFIFSAVALEAIIGMVARDYVLNKKSAPLVQYIGAIDCSLFEKEDPTGLLYEYEIVKKKADGSLSISNTSRGIDSLIKLLYSNLSESVDGDSDE